MSFSSFDFDFCIGKLITYDFYVHGNSGTQRERRKSCSDLKDCYVVVPEDFSGNIPTSHSCMIRPEKIIKYTQVVKWPQGTRGLFGWALSKELPRGSSFVLKIIHVILTDCGALFIFFKEGWLLEGENGGKQYSVVEKETRAVMKKKVDLRWVNFDDVVWKMRIIL